MQYLVLCLYISFEVHVNICFIFLLYRSDINSHFLMIRVFMVLQVVFPTFDPPEVPASMGGVGHWVSVFLDLKNSRFQLLDSYYGPKDIATSSREASHSLFWNIIIDLKQANKK